ncbi:MAG: macro domain-containing protein [Eubacterium sp.]|nr:macro domain-containing protein [Eubacterium sp.]
MPFQIIRHDITKVKADAIVNTANPDVAIGPGVDAAIYAAAGRDELLCERAKIGTLMPGEVGITPAFQLKAKHIIHVSGPVWEDGYHGEAEILRRCYDKALYLAAEHGCKSIAFPLIAAGNYGFPKGQAVQIAIDAFTKFLEEYEMEITLAVYADDCVKVSGELVGEIKAFIDDEYVCAAPDKIMSMMPDVGHISGRAQRMRRRQPRTASVKAASQPLEVGSLEEELKEIYTDSFAKHLQQLINKKGLKNSQVYAAANISKQYFSKLLKGQVKPSKEKMLALAVGLRLNLDEAIDFLGIAGYALSPISQTDVVVRYFIMHEDYSVIKINIVLFDYGLDAL